MLHILKTLIPHFSYLQEFELKNSIGENIGFHSSLITTDNLPFAGGSAKDLNQARRICAAESIERAIFYKCLKTPNDVNKLLLDKYPTTCGFAAGFEEKKTIFRAICEAVERWAWSKWIDEGYKITTVNMPKLNDTSKYFLSQFEEVLFFKTNIKLNSYLLPKYISNDLIWTVVIGLNHNGAFPGSRVTTAQDELWEHSLLEAWRHQLIFKNELENKKINNLFEKRIKYFGDNKEVALRQSRQFEAIDLPMPKLKILENAVTENYRLQNEYYVYRALCDDYLGWECGDETRFIY